MNLFVEIKRRNVIRAGVLYVGALWALAQGISQLAPSFGAPEWVTRWVVIAGVVGFPFWIALAWFYEWTPQGLKRESDIAPQDSITHHTGRKLDFAIIGVLAVAVVLLVTDRFVSRKATDTSDKSIAVLPLQNDSGDKDQQYFSDGLSEDLITTLSQFAGLKVIGRTSSFQFRDSMDDARTICTKLGVAHLLEGSVRRAGDIVRISAELISATDGSTLWSQRYDRPYKDLFALQDEITQSVAAALKTKLLNGESAQAQSERPPSGRLDAYTAYLQGKFYQQRDNEADLHKAFEEFTAATRLDPRYAAAFAQLSFIQTQLGGEFLGGKAAQDAFSQARAAADTALTLAPDMALALGARGYLLEVADLDWRGAEAQYLRAVQLAPDDGEAKVRLARLSATLGKVRSAIDMAQQALATDPLRASWHGWLGVFLAGAGRIDEAETATRKAIELQPSAESQHNDLATYAILRGDAAAALAAAQAEQPGQWQEIALALARQIGPDRAAADAALQKLIDERADVAAYQIAEAYAVRNDPDRMFEWLERAWSNRDSGIGQILYDPLVLRYKGDPRMAAFCHEVGLPAPAEVTHADRVPDEERARHE
jgi:TolB-like protein/Tfp pilus assembly protein PilF